MPFFDKSDATLIYNQAAACLGCLSASDRDCLETKNQSSIYDCTMSTEALLHVDGGAFTLIRDKYRITQLGEPYAPVTGTPLLPIDPYIAMYNGLSKPGE